jgi:hypothetical protein
MVSKSAVGNQVATTYYDYMWNSGSPTRMVYHNGWSYMGFVGRTGPSPVPREFTYVSYDGTTFLAPTPGIAGTIDDTYFSGLDVFRGGAVDGIAGLASGFAPSGTTSQSWWCVESTVGQGDFAQFMSTDDRDTQPLVLDPAGKVLMYDSEGRTDYSFNMSTDFGVNWTEINTGILAQGSVPGDQSQGTLDVSLILSPNGNVVVGTTIVGLGAGPPYDTAPPDSADQWGYWVSTDEGVNWTWNKISHDGEETLPGYFNLSENFGQVDLAVDGNNKVHAVSNGYAVRAAPDTSAATIGVTYWNETVGFKEITTSFNKEWAIIDTSVLNLYPGNALGCSYPTVTVSDDGMLVVAAWCQPNFTETTIDTLDGFMLGDLWYNMSADGGATWGTAMNLTNTNDRTELFPTLADDLELVSSAGSGVASATYRARVLYMEDTHNGASPFGEGPEEAEPIVYLEFDVTTVTSVEPIGGTVPEEYGLEQNYPNPFNPTTNVNYSIPTAGFVTLKVYDLLGQEVATLVNQEQVAGSYRVDFNAADLANGAYFYRLTAGTFTDVKKMVLMK